MNTDDFARRLEHLESTQTHLERQYDELNQAVIEQAKLLKRMQSILQRLTESVETGERDRIRSTSPKPPHYQ